MRHRFYLIEDKTINLVLVIEWFGHVERLSC